MFRHSPTIELLAPAGDKECMKAAVECGADAVYFGLERGFNARARATNLSLDQLPETMSMLRQRRVKGYVTLNTLVFASELREFESVVIKLADAGVDAVLIQDLGAVRLVRDICPELDVHASTQMTLTCAEAINRVAELGVDRVVLARELSLDEIQSISAHTSVPLEVFAHGALCVAYSGQCLTSESLGGRSANRGQCAQACRLPYDLICDGKPVDLDDVKYLLSPQDLAAYDYIPRLLAAGVTSLKIEGRLKSPEYVASVTQHYRAAIDATLADRFVQLSGPQAEEMELTFSRGFSPGWLEGCDHKRLVPGLSSAKRGVHVGVVTRIVDSRVMVRLHRRLKAGDGVMFDVGLPQNEQPGGRVFQICKHGKRLQGNVESGVVELRFHNPAEKFGQLQPGQQVWKTDDPQIRRALQRRVGAKFPQSRIDVEFHVLAHVGAPLRVTAMIDDDVAVHVASEEPLEIAQKHPVDTAFFATQLGRLGRTPFQCANLTVDVRDRPMVPLSVIGKLRRSIVNQLQEALSTPPRRTTSSSDRLVNVRATVKSVGDTVPKPQLHVVCRSLEQLAAVVDCGIKCITVDFADIRQYREATEMIRQSDDTIELMLATPRIHKPGEDGVLSLLRRYATHGVLVRNLAAIQYFRDCDIPFVADYSLNVANPITAEMIIEMGAKRATASYDLNRDQLLDLVQQTPPQWLEIVVHQHVPMFHMEHCVFCAVLSPGTNKTNCGRPCDDHTVHLKDRIGKQHLLTADVGCRNTLYNATPQSGAELVPLLLRQGVQWFRIELLDPMQPKEVHRVITLYEQLLANQIKAKAVWGQLKALNRVGITRGTLESSRDPLAIL